MRGLDTWSADNGYHTIDLPHMQMDRGSGGGGNGGSESGYWQTTNTYGFIGVLGHFVQGVKNGREGWHWVKGHLRFGKTGTTQRWFSTSTWTPPNHDVTGLWGNSSSSAGLGGSRNSSPSGSGGGASNSGDPYQDIWSGFPRKDFGSLSDDDRVQHILESIKYANKHSDGWVNLNQIFRGFRYNSKGGSYGYSPNPVQVTLDGKQFDIILSFWSYVDPMGKINPMIPFGGGQDQILPSSVDGLYYYHHTYFSKKAYGWSIGIGHPKKGVFSNYDYVIKWLGW